MYNLKSLRGVVDATEKVWSILCIHTTLIVRVPQTLHCDLDWALGCDVN
jgi:hypothetical protein